MSIRHDALELAVAALDQVDPEYRRQDYDAAAQRLRRALAIVLLWQRRAARAKTFVGAAIDLPQCDTGRTEPL